MVPALCQRPPTSQHVGSIGWNTRFMWLHVDTQWVASEYGRAPQELRLPCALLNAGR